MIDDQEAHVKSVTEAMREMGIDSLAFHITLPENQTLDEKQCEVQIRYLIQHEKWLSDDEVH